MTHQWTLDEWTLDGRTWTRGIGLLVLVAMVGMGCTGPSPRTSGDAEGEPPGERVVRVFHVQIETTDDKGAADRTVSAAQRWWRGVPPASRPGPLRTRDDLPVDVAWQAPFYRVRIGPFLQKDRAEQVLIMARDRFPDAFIAPERVER